MTDFKGKMRKKEAVQMLELLFKRYLTQFREKDRKGKLKRG